MRVWGYNSSNAFSTIPVKLWAKTRANAKSAFFLSSKMTNIKADWFDTSQKSEIIVLHNVGLHTRCSFHPTRLMLIAFDNFAVTLIGKRLLKEILDNTCARSYNQTWQSLSQIQWISTDFSNSSLMPSSFAAFFHCLFRAVSAQFRLCFSFRF